MGKLNRILGYIMVFCFLAAASQPLLGQGIIIDHTCTDISKVPTDWINTAKGLFRLSYRHTSHGSQIVSGMQVLMGQSPFYSYNQDGSGGALSLHDYEPSGDLGNPNRTEWAARTRTLLNSQGCDRNMIMWSWCGQASSATPADIDTYLGLMAALEADFPGVIFIYMTGHTDGTGVTGNLHQRNEQIRSFCRNNNRVLFDFADIESYDPDGNYFLDKGVNDNCDYDSDGNGSRDSNWASLWCAANPGMCSSCSCAHSQSLNCDLKGRAFWWMMARLSGWDGSPSSGTSPFGSFDTPVNGSTVRSSIPVTGWALDDVGVNNVKIYRLPVGTESGGANGLVYIGDANFVEGARPDVAQAYPGYPQNSRAGWGYMMLTNFLPNNGNITVTLYAIAADGDGQQTQLGQKTITCDNANAIKPFGAIDTPLQGGETSGSQFLNWAWALTPLPSAIPTDGSTIRVYVDGVFVGNPT